MLTVSCKEDQEFEHWVRGLLFCFLCFVFSICLLWRNILLLGWRNNTLSCCLQRVQKSHLIGGEIILLCYLLMVLHTSSMPLKDYFAIRGTHAQSVVSYASHVESSVFNYCATFVHIRKRFHKFGFYCVLLSSVRWWIYWVSSQLYIFYLEEQTKSGIVKEMQLFLWGHCSSADRLRHWLWVAYPPHCPHQFTRGAICGQTQWDAYFGLLFLISALLIEDLNIKLAFITETWADKFSGPDLVQATPPGLTLLLSGETLQEGWRSGGYFTQLTRTPFPLSF